VRGDPLSKIAKGYYGSAAENPLILEIHAGQVLRIPPAPTPGTAG
jgi:hypothetical protein